MNGSPENMRNVSNGDHAFVTTFHRSVRLVPVSVVMILMSSSSMRDRLLGEVNGEANGEFMPLDVATLCTDSGKMK